VVAERLTSGKPSVVLASLLRASFAIARESPDTCAFFGRSRRWFSDTFAFFSLVKTPLRLPDDYSEDYSETFGRAVRMSQDEVTFWKQTDWSRVALNSIGDAVIVSDALERFTTALHIHNDHGTNRWHHVE